MPPLFDLAKHLLTTTVQENTRLTGIKNKALQLFVAALSEMELLRQQFYTALDASWLAHVAGDEINSLKLKAVSQTSLEMARHARRLVNNLYPYCGLHAARTDTTINQVWRNINTASQHTLLVGCN